MESVFFRAVYAVLDFFRCAYESSVLKKVISAVCSFFERALDGCLIMKYLRSGILSGEAWRKSIVYKVFSSPIMLLRLIAAKCGDKMKNAAEKSAVCSFFTSVADIPVRETGLLLFFMAVGSVPTAIIFSRSYAWIAPAVSLILLAFAATPREIIRSGIAGKFILNTFFEDGGIAPAETKHIKAPLLSSAVCFVIGALLGTMHPLLALAFPVAVIAVGVILAHYEVGVYLTLPLIPILPTMALVGLIALTFVSFAIRLMSDKSYKYRVTEFSLPVCLYLTVLAVTTALGVNRLESLKVALVYAVFTLFFILVVNTVRTERQWKNVIFVMLITAAIVSLYGIAQNFFLSSTASSWVDSESFDSIKTRVYSTLSNPNVLGEYIILMFPIAFAVLFTKIKEWHRFADLAVNAVIFLCLLLTWSRGAWIGAVLAVGFFIMRKDKFWLALCVMAVLVVPTVIPADIITRLFSIGDISDSSTSYRVAIWVAGARLAGNYLPHGIGVGSQAFLTAYPEFALSGAEFALHSHNFYTQWLVDMGLPGLVSFIMIISASFRQVVTAGRKSHFTRTVMLAMGCALIGWLFQGIAENLWYNNRMLLFFWAYMGLLASGAYISRDEEAPTLEYRGTNK